MINPEKSQGKYRIGFSDTIDIGFGENNDRAGLAIAIAPRP